MSAVIDHHAPHGHDHAHDDHHGAPAGWRRWVYATNHKDIGTLYLLFSFTMLMIGGLLAMLIRLELFHPGLQFVNPQLFNQQVLPIVQSWAKRKRRALTTTADESRGRLYDPLTQRTIELRFDFSVPSAK
jgi:hypothetical protein